MRCDRCGFVILKADNYCSHCGAPNPRQEHAAERMRAALLGTLEQFGVDTGAQDGAAGIAFLAEFERRMWPEEEGRA